MSAVARFIAFSVAALSIVVGGAALAEAPQGGASAAPAATNVVAAADSLYWG
jgi:hypothetical protein